MLKKITKPEALELFAKTAKKEIAEYQSGKKFHEYEKNLDGVTWTVTKKDDEKLPVLLYREDEETAEFYLPAEFAKLSLESFNALFLLIEASVSYGRNSGATDAFTFADQVLIQEKRGWWA
jgi:hypothetical protein